MKLLFITFERSRGHFPKFLFIFKIILYNIIRFTQVCVSRRYARLELFTYQRYGDHLGIGLFQIPTRFRPTAILGGQQRGITTVH